MRIITRAQWGARHAPGPYTRKVGDLETWLHHTVTVAPDTVAPFSDDYAAVRAVESITEERFGWGMAYTFLVSPAGLVFEGHPIDRVGAHTAGHNTAGAGIALLGNYERDKPTRQQLDAVADLLAHGAGRWWRKPRLSGGHRDTKATACPGKHAYELIDRINQLAHNGGAEPVKNPTPNAPREEYDMDTLDLRNAHKRRVKGKHVDNLQGLLMAAGYGPAGLVSKTTGRPDGVAGPATRRAAGAFQKKHNTGGADGKPDYIVGAGTWRALIER